MARKNKPQMEYRYYELPVGSPLLALQGEKWVQNYGKGIDTLHFHNHLEIGICYYGDGILIMDEEDCVYHKEMFTVLPKNYPHTTNSKADTFSYWEYLFIDVDGFLQEMYKESPHTAERLIRRINRKPHLCDWEEQPVITGQIRHLMEIMRKREEFYLEEAKGVLWALLMEIARWNQGTEEQTLEQREDGEQLHPGNASLIAPALDYISEHIEESIRVEYLSGLCHISENYFRKVFRECMNMTPVEYINWIRIKRACDEMATTDDSIAAVANRVGFTQISTFNRNFRQLMGTSPREWRKNPDNYQRKLLKYTIKSKQGW